jgi:hypothetical protein
MQLFHYVRPLGIAGTGMNAEPDLERVANVLIRIALRVLVQGGNQAEGELNADTGVLSRLN